MTRYRSTILTGIMLLSPTITCVRCQRLSLDRHVRKQPDHGSVQGVQGGLYYNWVSMHFNVNYGPYPREEFHNSVQTP